MSDPKLTDCPECGALALKKQLTAAAFKLKGTGWYETDFKNSGKKPSDKSASETADKGEGSATSVDKNSGSDSKSEQPKKAAAAE